MIIELKITHNPETGALGISGPIQNKLLVYGMLELAKEAIASQEQQAAPQITLPPSGLVIPR